MGVTQGYISQWESSGDVSLENLLAVCDALACSVDYLLGRDVDYGTETLRGRAGAALEKMPSDMQEIMVSMLEVAGEMT
jgi:transcriptional regulator with XRE-family HTH domain